MKFKVFLMLLTLFFAGWVFAAEDASAQSTLGVMYLQEMEGEERSWLGGFFRAMPSVFGLGFEVEGLMPLEEDKELPYQINPGIFLSAGRNLKFYGGGNLIITYFEEDFNIHTDRFYAKAGVQYNFGFLSLLAQGRTVVPLEEDLPFDFMDKKGLEFGAGLTF